MTEEETPSADGAASGSGIEGAEQEEAPGLVSPGRARYALGLLLVVYIFNFIDRQILSILLEQIKQDIELSDFQLGLLGGIAFALFYTFAGIPIARWADVGSRRFIIVLGLTTWSVMTALTGRATSFAGLLAARIGVGIGEAAGSPPSHSLITDYFPVSSRARALSTYALGIPIGGALGTLIGGWVGDYFGWRVAFLVVGIPGVLLAVLVALTLPEPRIDGRRDAGGEGASSAGAAAIAPSSTSTVGEVVRYMAARRSFLHLSMAGALHAFVGYGVALFNPAFFIRLHGLSQKEVASYLFFIALIGGIGTYLGGWCVDRLRDRDVRWSLWIPAISTVLAVPIAGSVYVIADPHVALLVLGPAVILGAMYLGPTFAMTQSIAKPHMRALASAVLLFIINLVGLGLGPSFVGGLSDLLVPRFAEQSLRWAIFSVVVVGNLWSAVHYLLAARDLKADLAAATAPADVGR